jgi:serine O-acetyltransferase
MADLDMENVNSNLPYYIYKVANTLYRWKIPILPFVIQQFLRFAFCCYVPYKAKLGHHVHFGHMGMGIVLHRNCVIGDHVRIDQHVTIGGRKGNVVPVIGNHVRIGAGAKVLGAIKIGNYASIGANAVVLENVPEGATAVGVPARIIINNKSER